MITLMPQSLFLFYLLRLYSTSAEGHQVLQPTKDVKFGQYVCKVAGRRKNPWCTKTASNLQPSDLRSNAYRSLPGRSGSMRRRAMATQSTSTEASTQPVWRLCGTQTRTRITIINCGRIFCYHTSLHTMPSVCRLAAHVNSGDAAVHVQWPTSSSGNNTRRRLQFIYLMEGALFKVLCFSQLSLQTLIIS